jgi:hypothetical protein
MVLENEIVAVVIDRDLKGDKCQSEVEVIERVRGGECELGLF